MLLRVLVAAAITLAFAAPASADRAPEPVAPDPSAFRAVPDDVQFTLVGGPVPSGREYATFEISNRSAVPLRVSVDPSDRPASLHNRVEHFLGGRRWVTELHSAWCGVGMESRVIRPGGTIRVRARVDSRAGVFRVAARIERWHHGTNGQLDWYAEPLISVPFVHR